MANFILRQIDDHLWVQVKTRAQSEGRSLKWIVIRLLELYAEGVPLPDKPLENAQQSHRADAA